MSRRRFDLIVFALIPALMAVASAASAPPETEDYRDWLRQEEELIDKASAASAVSHGRSLGPLPAALASAEHPVASLSAEATAWLAEDCAAVEAAKPAARTALLKKIAARLREYQRVLSGRPAAAEQSRWRGSLRRVLSAKEFAWPSPRQSWWQRIFARLGDFIRHLLNGTSGITRQAITIIALSALALLIGLTVWTLVRRPRGAGSAPASYGSGQAGSKRRRGDDLLSRAEEAAAAGDFRAAMRYLYVALLQQLDRADLIRLVKSKTNWDYRREIQRSQDSLAGAFGEFTDLYEMKWYGREKCSAEHYAEARRLFAAAGGASS